MSVESSFLSKLIESGDYDTVDETQIKPRFFNGRYRRMFKYIQDFKTKYGKVPSLEEFTRKFPQFETVETEEPMRYYCDEVRLKVKHNTIADGVEEVQEAINEDMDTEKAYSIIKRIVSHVENEIILGDTRKIYEDTKKRWDNYLMRRDTGGITGIPTGLIPFDLMTGGLGATDLITILGFTGVGKTWAEVILAVSLAKAGYKVLFATKEMNTDQVLKRVDAVWSGVSYNDFNRGRLCPKDEEKFKQYLDHMEGNEDNKLIIELVTGGVTNISSLIDKHQPDVVVVDGAYLMTDDSEDGDWKGIMQVWRDLKQISLSKKIPIITSSQLKESEKVSLGKISFAKAIANECDVVVALEQTEEMRNDKEIKWKPLKLRDAEMGMWFMTNWDWSAMNYEPIYVEGKFLQSPRDEDLPEMQSIEEDAPAKFPRS